MVAERSFTKTLSNNATEKEGVSFLLGADACFQKLGPTKKNELLQILKMSDRFTNRVFDLVQTPEPVAPLSSEDLHHLADQLVLVETKATKKQIWDRELGGFFFGATENEYNCAKALGRQYKFAFVVLSHKNAFGAPFYELLDLTEVESRTKKKRIQFQVNLKGRVPRFGRPT